MTVSTRPQQRPGPRLGRKAIHQLRTVLERDVGQQAAGVLQEAGFAAGEELYADFAQRLRDSRGVERPGDLDLDFLAGALSEFFADQGWGTLAASPLGPALLALDASDWAEALDQARTEFPTCHLSCGLLADFLGRMADGLVAVMEVECRSRGDTRCRFVAGAPETLSSLYDRMARGMGYGEAIGIPATS